MTEDLTPPPPSSGLTADPLPGDSARAQLPERVVRYWQLQSLLGWGAVALIGAVITVAAADSSTAPALAIGVPVLLGLLDALIVQPRRRRLWWYAVGEHQLDLQHGWLWHTRTVVPMTRVQHIAMRRGPLADAFSLAELEIYTAAGSVKIPALDRDEAIAFRHKVATFARLADDL